MKEVSSPTNLDEKNWRYNGIDCCVTFEVLEKLEQHQVGPFYTHSMQMVAPYLDMSLRGFRVNHRKYFQVQAEAVSRTNRLQQLLNRLARGFFGTPEVNPKSYKQVKELFENLGITLKATDKNQLQKKRSNFWAAPFVELILAIRDSRKQTETLQTALVGNRWMFSLNVGGTSTGRLSSKKDPFKQGQNIQNPDSRFKEMFIPDPGFTLVDIDLEQADSRNVGAVCLNLFNDSSYLDACEGDDLHTFVASLIWPDRVKNREDADQPFSRFTYRDMAKRCGHATNFNGTASGISTATGVPAHLVKAFQEAYYDAFPVIRRWQQWTAEQIRAKGEITNLYQRKHTFLDRRNAEKTLRDALAMQSQSMTSYAIDKAIYQLWQEHSEIQLLCQVHDSVVFQTPTPERIPEYLQTMRFSIPIGTREFSIPLGAAYGKNWGKQSEANLEGLRAWTG